MAMSPPKRIEMGHLTGFLGRRNYPQRWAHDRIKPAHDTSLEMAITAEEKAMDSRVGSINAVGFHNLIGDLLSSGEENRDIHSVARLLRQTGIYPARDLAGRCSNHPPLMFISYDWTTKLFDLEELIQAALKTIADKVRASDLSIDIDRMLPQLPFWLDFVFLDQSARDLRSELSVLPSIIAGSEIHYVISPRALTRSWCCYEMALFNSKFCEEGADLNEMRSLLCPQMQSYRLWDSTQTTEPTDRQRIEEEINARFRGGIHQIDLFLIQASLITDQYIRLTREGYIVNDVETEAANKGLLEAVVKWRDSEI